MKKLSTKKKKWKKKINQDSQKIVNSERIVYNNSATRFFDHKIETYNIVTRWVYSTVKDLLEGKQPKNKTCYIQKNQITFEFDNPIDAVQQKALLEMGLNPSSVLKYRSYCNYN